MAVKWFKTSFLGVRYREHTTRKHGIRPDRCYSIRYKLEGKDKEEVVGWASEGVTAEVAYKRLSELRDNSRSGSGAKTLKEKRSLAHAAEEAQKKAKKIAEEKDITLANYWEHTYSGYAKNNKKSSSFRPEETHMRLWILPLLGNYSLAQVSIKEWDLLVHTLNENNLSQRSKEYITGTLRRLMRHAQDRGLPVTIPTAKQIGVQTPKENRRLRVLTQGEGEQLIKKLRELDPYTERLTQFCMLTGCRLSEAVNLTWANVYFTEKYIRFVNTKNKDSRIFYMSDELYALLLLLPQKNSGDNVFTRKDGMPFFLRPEKTEVPHYFSEAVKLLGLNEGRTVYDRVTFHTIRHTVATNLAKVLDVRSLMDVMGWKVVAIAARYIHTQEDTKRNAANLLAEAWKK